MCARAYTLYIVGIVGIQRQCLHSDAQGVPTICFYPGHGYLLLLIKK